MGKTNPTTSAKDNIEELAGRLYFINPLQPLCRCRPEQAALLRENRKRPDRTSVIEIGLISQIGQNTKREPRTTAL